MMKTFDEWLQESAAAQPLTGPMDAALRAITRPVQAAAGPVGRAVDKAAKRTVRAIRPKYKVNPSAAAITQQMTADTDWDALAQGGIRGGADRGELGPDNPLSNLEDRPEVQGAQEPDMEMGPRRQRGQQGHEEDQANFGFTTERQILQTMTNLKKYGKSLAQKTKEMLVGVAKETGTISYQTLQSPDVVLVRPANKFLTTLARLCKIIKEKAEPAAEGQSTEMIEQAIQECHAEMTKLKEAGEEYKDALKMVGYGTVMGHWIFALGTYLYFTGQLVSFEHWLNDHTWGLGVAALIGYKIFVNAVFFTLPYFKKRVEEDPESFSGKFGAKLIKLIGGITPSVMKHHDEEEVLTPLQQRAKDYDKFGKTFSKAVKDRRKFRKAGHQGPEAPLPTFETTSHELYDSAVRAFPRTTRRQHAVDPIKITQMEWVPYLGVKTLYVKGLAQNTENGKEYHPMVLFKNVQYSPVPHRGLVEIVASDGNHYHLEKLGHDENDIQVRCDCKDFHWRFNYYDHLDNSLYGRKRSKYESQGGPAANPQEMPGMCKHIMKFMRALTDSGLVE